MADLFPELPEQRKPDTIRTDRHALIRCSRCKGSGVDEPIWPDEEWPCLACNGAGCIVRSVGEPPF